MNTPKSRQVFLIGIDIGGTKCAVILGNADGAIADKVSFPTEKNGGPGPALDRIFLETARILEKNSLGPGQVSGIGVSCGSPLNSKKGLILSPPNLPGWDNVAIADLLKNKFGVPAFLQNDANACALAEWQWGAGKGCRNMIFLTFGTGFGSGLILDGRLYSGTNDMAGEIGHVRLSDNGPVGYGKEGSAEGFCSGGGVAQIARQEILKCFQTGKPVGFCPSLEAMGSITARDVGLAADRGDPVARDILAISGRYLGRAAAILIDLFNPERIVIGSIFLRCRDHLLPHALEVIGREALTHNAEVCTILPAGLGEEVGDYAALGIAKAGAEGLL